MGDDKGNKPRRRRLGSTVGGRPLFARSWPVHGQNGIGEGGAIGALAAIANAVDDALASLGVEVDDAHSSAVEICAGARQVGAGHLKPVQFDYAAAVNAVSMLLAMLHQLFFSDRK